MVRSLNSNNAPPCEEIKAIPETQTIAYKLGQPSIPGRVQFLTSPANCRADLSFDVTGMHDFISYTINQDHKGIEFSVPQSDDLNRVGQKVIVIEASQTISDTSSTSATSEKPADVDDLEWSVFEATNKLRQNPQSFIPYLEERLSRFVGNIYYASGSFMGLITQEGPAAVREAITELEKAVELPPLEWRSGMAKAC